MANNWLVKLSKPKRLKIGDLSQQAIFEISNIHLDSEAVRTKTIEARWNECEKYLHIIHFPLSLSSKPLFQAEFEYSVYQKGLFTTCTNPIIHLFYPPKNCIGNVFDFSWDIFLSQEKLQTMVMQKSLGIIEVYYGIVQVVNL